MKTLSFISTLALSLSIAACAKDEKKSQETPKAETTEKSAEVKAESTKTAVLPAGETAAEEPGHECGAAEGKSPSEHEGMDCMKKTGELAEKGEGAGCNKWDDAADKIAKQEIPADAKWSVMAVSGMTCGGCERRIIANVGKLAGVVGVEADSELGQVRVAVAEGNTEATDAAKAAIANLGYKLQ